MNPVSLSGMIRYFLERKKIFLLILLIPAVVLSAWGYFQWHRLLRAQPFNERENSLTLEELENKLNSELPANKKDELYQNYPHLLGDKLYRSQEKLYIAAADPNRTEDMNQFFAEFTDLTKEHLKEFNILAKEKFSLSQLNQLVKIISRPKEKTFYLRGYGPTQESADYLRSILIQQFHERADELPIESNIITLSTESVVAPKKPFLEEAIKKFIEKDEFDESAEKDKDEEKIELPALPKQIVKYAGMGLALGIVISLLLLVFGSSANHRYLSLREWLAADYPIVGAYHIDPKKKMSIDSRLFAQSLLSEESELIDQAIFKMIPTFRSDAAPLLFLYDEQVPLERWQEKFSEYGIAITAVSLKINPALFRSMINNGAALILVSKENFLRIANTIHPYLTKDSAIVLAL